MEPILVENENRFVLFPIKHPGIFALAKKHFAVLWKAEEVDLADDLIDWQKLTDNERYFIKHVLAFFAASDGIVNENLAVNMHNMVQYPEARYYYTIQLLMESVHSEMYSLLIDTYVKDSIEKDKLFNAIQNYPAIQKKADWALKWIEKGDFREKLIAFACVEGIFFSGSFCSIFWLKNRQLMPGLGMANEFISRDEGLHCEFAIFLYNNHIENKLDTVTIQRMIDEALKIEKEFILEALPVRLIGMNSESMSQYLEYVADGLLQDLGVPKMYNKSNPFPFMANIALEGKTNFFEKRVSDYQQSNGGEIKFNDDF